MLGWFGLGVVVVALAGCGGSTDRSPHESGGAPAGEREVGQLRFSKVAAGMGRYCGLELETSALVCVADGKVSLERPGPFLDFALHEDLDVYRELCTVDQAGALACELFQPELPVGSFHTVALGFFNGCALDAEGRATCWVPEELGGTPWLAVAGASGLSVDMGHACVVLDVMLGHVQCFGGPGDDVVNGLHFRHISASPKSACGFSVDQYSLGAVGVFCVDEQGATQVLPGVFSSLDTDVNGGGCASDTDGLIRCWGGGSEPGNTLPLGSVSVSVSQVCGLDADGAAHCFAR